MFLSHNVTNSLLSNCSLASGYRIGLSCGNAREHSGADYSDCFATENVVNGNGGSISIHRAVGLEANYENNACISGCYYLDSN